MHLKASINQQRAVKHFMKTYLDNLFIPAHPIRLPDFIDGDDDGEEEEMRRTKVRANQYRNDCDHGNDLESCLRNATNEGNGMSAIDEILGLNDNKNNKNEEDNLPTPPPAALDESQYLGLVTAEDYGMSSSFPHYRQILPQSDYFNSNLNWHNFVMSDISWSENNVF